jgi:Glucanosyltransferase
MEIFQNAGIYTIVGLTIKPSASSTYITNGRKMAYWDYKSWDACTKIVDIYQKYSNTLGFVMRVGDSSASGVFDIPWRRAMVRDMKDHISKNGYRNIPVGATAHEHELDKVPQYMNCGDPSSSIDFFGMEFSYSRTRECPNSTNWLDEAIFKGATEAYRGYSIPSFFFYGCAVKLKPDFKEVQTIYSNATTEVFSGGIVHEWLEDWDVGADLG